MTETLRTRIIELLSKNLNKAYSISDIAKNLGVAYSHTHLFIKELAEKEIIRIEKIGNVSVCRLNIKEPLTLSYLSHIEYNKSSEWRRKNPHSKKIMEKIESIKDNVHCVMIRGGKIIIIIPEKMSKPEMKIFKNRTVITRTQLKENQKYYSETIILHGAEKYWSLIS